jgi:UTP--glucose-1-phosphate uridylyltransferase
MARPLVGDEPFAVFFPDDVIFAHVPAIGQLLRVYERYGGNVMAVQRVAQEEVVHYGVVKPRPLEEGVYEVLDIIEKPSLEAAPSDLAAVGRDGFEPAVVVVLAKTPPDPSGEIQLTDGLALMLRQGQKLYACQLQGERFDAGRPLGLLKASLAEALRRPDMAQELRQYLQEKLS